MLQQGEQRWGPSTGSTGRFHLRLPPGQYQLEASTLGDQPFPRTPNLTKNQPLDDRRINTDRRLLCGFGWTNYRFDGRGQMGVSVLHVDAEQGIAPEGNATDAQSRYWRYPL